MPNILDVYGDTSLHGAVSALRENPEYYDDVSQAEIDYDDKQKLPESSFAWPEERAYPISGRDMAILSALYRNQYPPENEGVAVPPQVDANLEKAAYLYDFKLPSRKTKKEASQVKISSEDYLLPSEQKFPVRNIKEAAMVEKIIVKNAHVMGYDHLSQAAFRLIEKVATYKGGKSNIEKLHPVILKHAGLTLSNKDLLEASINRRLDFSKNEKCNEAYAKLAAMVDDTDFNRENLLKIASVLEQLDKTAQVRHLYDKHILNPIESVFNTLKPFSAHTVEKTASEGVFTEEMAESVNEEQVRALLGDDVLEEAKDNDGIHKGKLVEVVNSLPNEMVQDFVARIS
jgi:hypothetical protein